MKKSYAFFDIDGTLLPEGSKTIPQDTVDSINKLKENGVEVFICTGRCYCQAKQYIDQLQIDSYIVSNGQEAVYKGKEIYSYNLSDEEIAYLKKELEQSKVFFGFETREQIHLQDMPGTDDLKKTIEGYGLLEVGIGNIDDADEVKQMWAFGDKEELSRLENNIIDKFKFFRWSDDSLEIVPLEESKAKAMKKVVELSKGDVITYAFGDGYNDMELITQADVGVAMGNAKLEIKAVADYVTDDCKKDGITKALEHFDLI